MHSYLGGGGGQTVGHQEGGRGGMYSYPDRRLDMEAEDGDKQPTAPLPPSYEELFLP